MNAPRPAPAAAPRPRTRPVRRRLSSEDRRQQLLDRAVELFAKHGFNGTRTKDIAAACGVSEGILFRHFATKEDLYHAILDTHEAQSGSGEWLAEMKRLAEQRDDAAFVRCLVAQLLKSFRENAAFHRLLSYAHLEGHSMAGLFHERMGVATFGFLSGYVAQRQREGAFRRGDPAAMVLLLFAPALHFALNKYVYETGAFTQPDEQMTGELAGCILNGLKVPGRRNRGFAKKD